MSSCLLSSLDVSMDKEMVLFKGVPSTYYKQIVLLGLSYVAAIPEPFFHQEYFFKSDMARGEGPQ